MICWRRLTLVLSLVSSLSAGFAQTTSPVAPVPSSAHAIGTLNFNAAVLGTAEAHKTLGALQKKFLPREQELQKLNDAIEASKKELSDGGTKLTEAEKNQMLQELGAKDKQLQREAEDYKNDSQTESQQAFQQVAQSVFIRPGIFRSAWIFRGLRAWNGYGSDRLVCSQQCRYNRSDHQGL